MPKRSTVDTENGPIIERYRSSVLINIIGAQDAATIRSGRIIVV